MVLMKVILSKDLQEINEFKLGGFMWKYVGVGKFETTMSQEQFKVLEVQYSAESFNVEKPAVKKVVKKTPAKKATKAAK